MAATGGPGPQGCVMVQLLGWFGAGLVLLSYAQHDGRRLRQVNLAASVALLVFHVALGVWPSVAMELAVAAVNLRRLRQRRPVDDSPRPHPAAPATVG